MTCNGRKITYQRLQINDYKTVTSLSSINNPDDLKFIEQILGFLILGRPSVPCYQTCILFIILYNELTASCPHWTSEIGGFRKKYILVIWWIRTANSPGLCGICSLNWKENQMMM